MHFDCVMMFSVCFNDSQNIEHDRSAVSSDNSLFYLIIMNFKIIGGRNIFYDSPYIRQKLHHFPGNWLGIEGNVSALV